MDFKIFGRATAGNVVPIVVRSRRKIPTSKDMPFYGLTGLSVGIVGPNGVSVVTTGSFAYVADGQYVYNWNTAGLSPGNYYIVVTASASLADSTGTSQKGMIVLR